MRFPGRRHPGSLSPLAGVVDRDGAPNLDQRIALVTGSAQGIGRAIAVALAASGHAVVGVDVRDQEPRPLARAIRADLSVVASIDMLVADVGRVDVLVNNAAILVEKPIEEMS